MIVTLAREAHQAEQGTFEELLFVKVSGNAPPVRRTVTARRSAILRASPSGLGSAGALPSSWRTACTRRAASIAISWMIYLIAKR
jgi:hypothetical protein